ncbi:MAG: hypothetical protein EBY38_10755, partial [Flavobacteriaceae bacterium]|nr:hypothetical protein [Flavobacteriaceae bacterium]
RLREVDSLRKDMAALKVLLNGDASLSKREFETSPSLNGRIGLVVWGLWSHSGAPTGTQRTNYVLAQELYNQSAKLKNGIEKRVESLENELDVLGVPYTPGR